jgi:hypothetical protein
MKKLIAILAFCMLPLFGQLPLPYYPVGPSEISNATQLQAIAICTGTPSNTQVLTYSSANSCWQAGSLATVARTGAFTDLATAPSIFSNSLTPYNTGVGYGAANPANITGVGNAALGNGALKAMVGGGNNTAVGYLALATSTNGNDNTAVGQDALTAVTSGSYNTGVGVNSLDSNASGSFNAALGQSALYAIGTSYNTAVGFGAGKSISGGADNTSGTYEVLLGYEAYPLGGSDADEIVIGANAVGAGSNSLTLGSSAVTTVVIPGLAAPSGHSYFLCISSTGLVTSQTTACGG